MKRILGILTGLGMVLSSGAFAAEATGQQAVKTSTQKKEVKAKKGDVKKNAPKGRSQTVRAVRSSKVERKAQ